MKLTIRAAGAMKSGPERELVDDYLKRADQLARRVGILGVEEICVETKNLKSKADMTKSVLTVPTGSIMVVLDERGKDVTSRQIAKAFANWRDDKNTEVIFAIGSADGFDPKHIPGDAVKWRLGCQTWPHKLVRVMIAEQIYRSLSILAGTPYHRD